MFDVVVQKIMERGQFDTKPKGTDGLIILVQNKPDLRKSLVNFIDAIPVSNVGVWIIHGWDKAIPKVRYYKVHFLSWQLSTDQIT